MPINRLLSIINDQLTSDEIFVGAQHYCCTAQESRSCLHYRSHFPVDVCCCRMNPIFCLLASVHSCVGFSGSKNASVGVLARCSFALDRA